MLRLELQLYSPGSLKEKRAIVKSILGRCRERFPVSCAETGAHDVWQRSELGFSCTLSRSDEGPDALFEKIEEEILRSGTVEICDRYKEVLHYN